MIEYRNELFDARGFSYTIEADDITPGCILKTEQTVHTVGEMYNILKNYQYALDNSKIIYGVPGIKKVIFNGPATIVFWKDKTKTVVKMSEEEPRYDYEKGFAFAVLRKLFGGMYNKELKKVDEACYRDTIRSSDGDFWKILCGLRPTSYED